MLSLRRFFFVIGTLLFFSIEITFGQSNLLKQWDYRFGGTNHEELTSFQQTFDNG